MSDPMTNQPPTPTAALLAEWKAEVKKHGIWTNEHSIAARLATALAAVDEQRQITGDTSDGYHTFNELYAYREVYNALLFNEWARLGLYDVHKSWRHSDGELCFGGGWFIVVAQTPEGQVSNHYKTDTWALFNVPERERGAEYDGHTPQVALERMRRFAIAERAEASAATLKAELNALREALKEALNEWEYASQYKGDYLARKHGDSERITDLRALHALETD